MEYSVRDNSPEGRSYPDRDVCVGVTGGEVGGASFLTPKIGPLDLSPKKIVEGIAKVTTMDWRGLRVTVKIMV